MLLLKGELRPKIHPCSYGVFLNDFIEKETCTKLSDVLISSL